MVEQADLEHRGQDVADHLVQARRGDLARLHGGLERVTEELAAGHLDVEAGVGGLGGAVRRAPVGDDEAREVPHVTQRGGQQRAVLARVGAVEPVIGAHHRADVGVLDGGLEGGEVDLLLGAFVDLHVDAAAQRLLVVGGEVLDGGDDVLALEAADLRDRELAGQERVLAEGLKRAAPQRDPQDVDRRGERHVAALAPELAAHRLPHSPTSCGSHVDA